MFSTLDCLLQAGLSSDLCSFGGPGGGMANLPSKPGSAGWILGEARTARPDSRPPSCPHSLLAEPALACCLLASSVSSARWTRATALLCALLSGTVRSFGSACLYPVSSHGTVFAGLALRGLGSMPEQRDSIPITLFVWGMRGRWRLSWH